MKLSIKTELFRRVSRADGAVVSYNSIKQLTIALGCRMETARRRLRELAEVKWVEPVYQGRYGTVVGWKLVK